MKRTLPAVLLSSIATSARSRSGWDWSAVPGSCGPRTSSSSATFPRGTPIDLLANLNAPGTLDDPAQVKLRQKIVLGLLKVDEDTASLADVPGLVDNLLALNKCRDFVLDRGHPFGSQLPDEDKRALIEFLKTL